MRRALFLGVLMVLACRTTQPPSTEEALPIDSPGQERLQDVPAEPPGPAEPLTAPVDAGTPDAGTPEG